MLAEGLRGESVTGVAVWEGRCPLGTYGPSPGDVPVFVGFGEFPRTGRDVEEAKFSSRLGEDRIEGM